MVGATNGTAAPKRGAAGKPCSRPKHGSGVRASGAPVGSQPELLCSGRCTVIAMTKQCDDCLVLVMNP